MVASSADLCMRSWSLHHTQMPDVGYLLDLCLVWHPPMPPIRCCDLLGSAARALSEAPPRNLQCAALCEVRIVSTLKGVAWQWFRWDGACAIVSPAPPSFLFCELAQDALFCFLDLAAHADRACTWLTSWLLKFISLTVSFTSLWFQELDPNAASAPGLQSCLTWAHLGLEIGD